MRPRPARFPLLRPPPLRSVLVVALAIVVGISVHRATASASSAAAALGDTRTVAVATAQLEAGAVIEAGDVEMVDRPRAHLPATAVDDDPTGLALRSSVAHGEVLVAERLAGADRSGAAALVPAGWRAVTVPVIDAALPAEPGDLVDVVASFDPTVTARDPSLVIATDAVVVDVTEEAVTVAVTRERVTEVAFALANGIVSLALVG